jgi:hypothetical protein
MEHGLLDHLEECQLLKVKIKCHPYQHHHLINLFALSSFNYYLQINLLCIYETYLVHNLQLLFMSFIIHFAYWLENDQITKSFLASFLCICCPNTSKDFRQFITSLNFMLNLLLELFSPRFHQEEHLFLKVKFAT